MPSVLQVPFPRSLSPSTIPETSSHQGRADWSRSGNHQGAAEASRELQRLATIWDKQLPAGLIFWALPPSEIWETKGHHRLPVLHVSPEACAPSYRKPEDCCHPWPPAPSTILEAYYHQGPPGLLTTGITRWLKVSIRTQGHVALPEPTSPTTASPRYLNTHKVQENNLKSYVMKMRGLDKGK